MTVLSWGYDPMQYGIPEGSYATNPNDGYSRVQECRHMVSILHENGIRVVMDVVYNHMFDINASGFERIVPGYYFRKDQNGKLSNGSWCGNDLNTKAYMVRKYIKDMCLRWQQFYGIDGFRFDLMGIIDIETLNQVYHQASLIDDDFIMYGEGWNMGTALDDKEKGMQDNHRKLLNIGFFNDYYRETLKGSSSDDSLRNKGYFSGNMYNCEISGGCMKNTNRYSYVDQSINYVECHDNATVYDKFAISNSDENVETLEQVKMIIMKHFLDLDVFCFRTIEDMISTDNHLPDIFITEILFHNSEKGIKMAHFILKKKPDCKIIYYSQDTSYIENIF